MLDDRHPADEQPDESRSGDDASGARGRHRPAAERRCGQCPPRHHRLAEDSRRALDANLPAGTEEPDRDERPRHQSGPFSRYEQRPRYGFLLYEGGRPRTGGSHGRSAGEGAPAACLWTAAGQDSGSHADAAGHRGCRQPEPVVAEGPEPFGAEPESRRLYLPPGRPGDAGAQQLR